MNHDDIEEHTTDRYFLDELTEAERNEFEDHYFDCTICAADVRAAARMMAAGREIAREKLPAPIQSAEILDFRPRRPWERWYPRLASAAAGLFAVVIGWQGMTIQGLRAVSARGGVTTFYGVTTSQTRGLPQDAPLDSIRVDEIATVIVEILPPAQEVTGFVISVRDARGRVQQTDTVSFEKAADQVPVTLRALPRGSYQLVIEGVRKSDGNRFEITRDPFEVV